MKKNLMRLRWFLYFFVLDLLCYFNGNDEVLGLEV